MRSSSSTPSAFARCTELTRRPLELVDRLAALIPPPHYVELHVSIQELNYIDHACLELLEGWAEKYESIGGRLIIEWDHLHGKYHKKETTSLALAPSQAGGEGGHVAYISHEKGGPESEKADSISR